MLNVKALTEAEIYNIIMLYAQNVTSHFEFYIVTTMAMIVAIFVVGNKLNI